MKEGRTERPDFGGLIERYRDAVKWARKVLEEL